MAAPEIRFRPYISAEANYDTGLANVAITDHGQLANAAAIGARLSWGVTGVHSWKRTRLGLNYHGDVVHYPGQGQYDSTDQSLMLGVNHQVTRHVSLSLSETAGLFSRNFGVTGLPETVPFDPSTMFIPNTDYFDNRTYYLGSQASVTYQKSARTSFNFSGGAFITKRRSSALDGSIAEAARGDWLYRISRRLSAGATYSYMHIGYTRTQGGTDVHTFGPTMGLRVNRWLELTGMLGVTRVESKFVSQTSVDPLIAQLLGITSAPQIIHRVDYFKIPNFMTRASRTFRTGVVYVSAGHSVMPGNGLFLTSYAYTVSAGYSYTGLRRWSINMQPTYLTADSAGTISGNYSAVSGRASIARKVGAGVYFIAAFNATRYGSTTYASYNRVIYTGTMGFRWSPGEVPLRLW
jgi:hypothetical protein